MKVKVDKQTGAVSFLDLADQCVASGVGAGRKLRQSRKAVSPVDFHAIRHLSLRPTKAFTALASISTACGIILPAVAGAGVTGILPKPTPTWESR